MKTLSGTFVFIVVAVIAILAVVSFRAFAGSKSSAVGSHKFKLKIGKTQTDYVDVTDRQRFIDVVKRFPQDGVDIYYLKAPNEAPEHWPPVPPLSIKTDKVTTSEVARNASAGESVANDPNVTRFLSSDNKTDIIDVLNTFQ